MRLAFEFRQTTIVGSPFSLLFFQGKMKLLSIIISLSAHTCYIILIEISILVCTGQGLSISLDKYFSGVFSVNNRTNEQPN